MEENRQANFIVDLVEGILTVLFDVLIDFLD